MLNGEACQRVDTLHYGGHFLVPLHLNRSLGQHGGQGTNDNCSLLDIHSLGTYICGCSTLRSWSCSSDPVHRRLFYHSVNCKLLVKSSIIHETSLLTILQQICAILSNIFVTMSVYWGNGKHFDVLSLEQKQNTIKWMMAAYVPGIETLGFPKLAVIALLARLLMPGKIHLVILWSMGIICCLSLTAMVTTLLLQCSPPRALWTLTMPRDCLAPSKLEGLAFWASC